jgi:hypothetical protein
MHGDAHVEADGVHFDGDDDYVSIPNFNYYGGQRFTISMWIQSAVCDASDPTPSVYGYVYSHAQTTDPNILTSSNQNINMYQSCRNGGFLRIVMVASRGFASWDVPVATLDSNIDPSATFTHFSVVYNTNTIEMYVNGEPPNAAQAPGSLGALMAGTAPGIGSFQLTTDIYVGGRADENDGRFYRGSIAGLSIFRDGLSASEVFCDYQHDEEMITGTTAHSCSFHSEGYRWIDPTVGTQCALNDPFCHGTTKASDLCSLGIDCPTNGTGGGGTGNFDDGYIHFPFVNYSFPFMGRAEQEIFVSTNGYISFGGQQASNGRTAPIPSQAANPDDTIFVYRLRFTIITITTMN